MSLMHRVCIQIRPDQREQLKALSRPGQSVASLIRQAVDEFLKKQS